MSRFGGKKWSILVSAAVYSYKNNSEVVSTYCSGYSAQVVTYFNVIVVYLDWSILFGDCQKNSFKKKKGQLEQN